MEGVEEAGAEAEAMLGMRRPELVELEGEEVAEATGAGEDEATGLCFRRYRCRGSSRRRLLAGVGKVVAVAMVRTAAARWRCLRWWWTLLSRPGARVRVS